MLRIKIIIFLSISILVRLAYSERPGIDKKSKVTNDSSPQGKEEIIWLIGKFKDDKSKFTFIHKNIMLL